MNTELRRKSKSDFQRDFFKVMNNSVFKKTRESVRKHQGIKDVITEQRRNYLVSKLVSKLSLNKVFIKKINSNRNEQKTNIHE